MSKTQQLSQFESQCCTYLPLGMETLNMLEYLSANEPGPFCSAVGCEIQNSFRLFPLGIGRSFGRSVGFQFKRTQWT